ncbi:MAG: hypothetical protein QM742_05940 [Aquabacterium sp.]
MDGHPGQDRRQQWIHVAFAAIWILALVFVLRHVQSQSGKHLGDWLIDYRQGFVRRGLPGAVFTPLASAIGWPVWYLPVVLVMGLWAVFLVRLAQLLSPREKPFWYLLLLMSPAGVAFGVYLIGDVSRKELIHLALLAQFTWLLDRRQLSLAWCVVLAAFAAVAGLAHEITVFYAAYFVVAAYWNGGGRPALMAAWAICLACAAAVLCVLYLAVPLDGAAYCRSLMLEQGASARLCEGIVLWDVLTVSGSLAQTISVARDYGYPSLYAAALLMTLGPVGLWMRRYATAQFLRTLVPIGIAVLASLPLFFIAFDWGRFIHVHVVSAALVLTLVLPRKAGQLAGQRFQAPPPLLSLRRPWVRRGLALATMASALLWQMPLCCQSWVDLGLLDKAGVKLGLWRRDVIYVDGIWQKL